MPTLRSDWEGEGARGTRHTCIARDRNQCGRREAARTRHGLWAGRANTHTSRLLAEDARQKGRLGRLGD